MPSNSGERGVFFAGYRNSSTLYSPVKLSNCCYGLTFWLKENKRVYWWLLSAVVPVEIKKK